MLFPEKRLVSDAELYDNPFLPLVALPGTLACGVEDVRAPVNGMEDIVRVIWSKEIVISVVRDEAGLMLSLVFGLPYAALGLLT